MIGGASASDANVIAFNSGRGVHIGASAGAQQLISGNSIFSNGLLGIDLAGDGVTANDAGDTDGRQNFPVLAPVTGGVSATLNSTANTLFTIQFFSNTTCDASGHGEGQVLLGSATVTTNGSGNGTIPVFAAAAGTIVTAVAIRPSGDSSEFSACATAGAGTANLGVTNVDSPDPSQTGSVIGYTITVTNSGPDTATGVTLEDTLTASVQFISAGPSQGSCSATTTTVTCSLGTIANGGLATVSIFVAPTTAGSVSNTATVSAAQTDPVSANNTATATTTVNAGPSTFLVFNTNDSGNGSLRQAITNANNTPGIDFINFAIPGTGVHTIAPQSPLPAVSETAFIDGFTQPGFTGTPLIELDGTNAGPATNGLVLAGSSITVTGLAINRFGTGGAPTDSGGSGILVLGPSANNSVYLTYLGTNAGGETALPNRRDGITVLGGTNHVIGASGNPNVISGNGRDGVRIEGSSSGTVVMSSFIGTNRTGSAAVGNTENGVTILTGGNVIGLPSTDRNIISGNGQRGIAIGLTGSGGNSVFANVIGANAALTAGIPNGQGGILINGSNDNQIGGGGFGNIIAFNTGPGVAILVGIDNIIATNSIHGNGGLGIDLNGDGVTLNDGTDGDAGPNNLQNFPVLSTVPGGIGGSLTSTPIGVFTIEYFGSPACNALGHGDGATLLGTAVTFADGAGFAAIPFLAAATGQVITATATDSFGNTSEFSACVAPGAPTTANVGITMIDSPDPVQVGAGLVYTITVTNAGPEVAGGVTVTDSLPGSVVLASMTPSQGTCQFTGQVVCTLGTIPNGGSATVTIGVTPLAGGTVTNTATVSTTSTDPGAGNNSATQTTLVSTPGTTFTVVNTNNAGAGSLREAIQLANASTGTLDRIHFGIPGEVVHTIAPTSFLPVITDPVYIDGSSQPGTIDKPLIVIDGVGAGINSNGFQIQNGGSGSTIRGLAIGRFGTGGTINAPGGAGIVIQGSGGANVIDGNFIGVNANGLTAFPNRADGIFIDNSPNNRIGGTASGARNVLSGNSRFGLVLNGAGTSGTVIQGNYIGPAIDLTDPDANQTYGIAIFGAVGNTIGDPNSMVAAANVIAFNTSVGVDIASGTGNLIRGNQIFSNGALGIDLEPAGSTPNDPGDADTGANGLQNFPVLTFLTNTGLPQVGVELNSTPNTTFSFDLYTSATCDSTGFRSAVTSVGFIGSTSDANGAVLLQHQLPASAEGQFLAGTASDLQGNTSEFSACVLIPRSMTLTAPSQLVGVGHVLNGTVNLTLPAPAGGVTITLSSDHPSFATVSPSSLTIAAGTQSASFTITGVAAGDATISATAVGYQTATFAVTATASSLITLGTGLVVAPGNSSGIALSLGVPAPTGGITVTLSSSDPSIATVTTTVFIPAGLQIPAANPQVLGVAIGSTNITAVATGFAPDTQSVAVTVSLSFSPASLTVIQGRTANIALNLSSPAPAGGLTINMSIDNPSVATVPSTVTGCRRHDVGGGARDRRVGQPDDAACQRAGHYGEDGRDYRESAAVDQRRRRHDRQESPGLLLRLSGASRTRGRRAGARSPASIVSKILIAPNGTTAGSASITFTIGAGSTFVPGFYVQALTDTGTAQFQTSATGLYDRSAARSRSSRPASSSTIRISRPRRCRRIARCGSMPLG